MDGAEGLALSCMFPLEPIGIFVGGEKMTSETGGQIRYWAHHQLAQEYYRDQNILSPLQFDLVNWQSIHQTFVIGHGTLAGSYLAEHRDSLK